MCQRNMVYTWYKENSQQVKTLCRCLNSCFTYPPNVKPIPDEHSSIKIYNSRREALEAGWKVVHGNWVCPECFKQF
jgi:hypothetical protein